MPAWVILRFARTSRWAIVASGTRNALAICGVVIPTTARSVSASRASTASAGWQQPNSIGSRSSPGRSTTGGARPWRSAASSSASSPLPRAPAQQVDRPPPGGQGEPARRVRRDAVAPPGPQRDRPTPPAPPPRRCRSRRGGGAVARRSARPRARTIRRVRRPRVSRLRGSGLSTVRVVVDHRPDLDRNARAAPSDGHSLTMRDRRIQVGHVDHAEPADVLLGLRERAVDDDRRCRSRRS